MTPPPKKIIIFVNEYFGAWDTARGGYGFIARKLLPIALNNYIITVCIGRSKKWLSQDTYKTEEGIELIKLPKSRILAARIINRYDLIISIEATVDYLFSLKRKIRTPILFWIQDPRTMYDWQEIDTVTLAKEPSYWNQKTYDLVHECTTLNLIHFATQAHFLSKKAIELYDLPENISIPFLPNPIKISESHGLNLANKKNNIIFLGRIDSVKRGWIFCEIAKRMPAYNFYVLGASTNEKEKKKNNFLKDYASLQNLHFLGHLEGNAKIEQLKRAKILINTSIHEALPVSFLEAFAYGITVISNQNPDNLVSKYGRYIGKSLGDGMDDVDKFVHEINFILSNEDLRITLSENAYEYVSSTHSCENFNAIFNNIIKAIN